jgi:hypothetical protein
VPNSMTSGDGRRPAAAEANIETETARLDEPLRAIVAMLAQALKRAKPKLVNVAAMWFEMIADCCGRDAGALKQYLHSGCSSSWCRRIHAQRRELYQTSHTRRPTSSVDRERPWLSSISQPRDGVVTGEGGGLSTTCRPEKRDPMPVLDQSVELQGSSAP